MCRRQRHYVGENPAFRLTLSFLHAKRHMSLLLGFLFLTQSFGCVGSGSSWRSLALNPLRPSRPIQAEEDSSLPVGAGQTKTQGQRNPNSLTAPSTPAETSKIQLVAAEDGSVATISESDSTALKSESRFDGPATQPELPASGVSMAELEAIAMQCNPTLRQAQSAVTAEQGFYRQAGLYPNPQIGYLKSQASNSGVKDSNGFFFSQEIVTAGKLDKAQQSAAQEIARYQYDYESQRMRIMNDLKIRYYEAFGAQEALAVSERIVKIAEHGVTLVEKNPDHTTKLDLLLAKIQLQTARGSRVDAENRYAIAWERVATIVGSSPMTPVPITGDLAADIPQLELEVSWQNLMANSPQLRSVEFDLGHANATYREARAQAIPNITIQVVGEYDRVTQASTYSVLSAWGLPIFNRNQGNIDKCAADITAAQTEITRVHAVLREQLADSFHRYKACVRHAESLRTEILPMAQLNWEATQELFKVGDISFKPVLDAQHTYCQSQLAYVETLIELHKVATEIQGFQLTGGLNPAAIGSAIQNQPGGGNQRQRALLNDVQDRSQKQLFPAAQIAN